MLINFFKNIFPQIDIFKPKENDPLSLMYKKLNSLVIKHKEGDEEQVRILKKIIKSSDKESYFKTYDMLHECFEKVIIDNNLNLVKFLYPHLLKESNTHYFMYHGTKSLSYTGKRDYDPNYVNNHHSIYYYAKVAMENNRIDLFDYFIQYGHKLENKPGFYEYSPKNNFQQHDAKSFLIETLVREEKLDYLNITKHYKLFNSEQYLIEHLSYTREPSKYEFSPYTPIIDEKEINFVLDKVIYTGNKDSVIGDNTYYKNFLSELLFELTRYTERQKPNLDLIKNFLNRDAELIYMQHYNNRIIAPDEKRCFNLANLLVDSGFKDIDGLALKAAQIKDNFSTIQFLLEKGANINLKEDKVDDSLYWFIKKRMDSKKLSEELSNELVINDKSITKPKKNKL
jgi:hypothetical protein